MDGREYVDLCLGDTGAMTGHSPDVVTEAVARRVCEGITLMLPTEDALRVGEDLKRRYLPAACKGEKIRRESLLDSNRAGNHAALADFELERFLHLYALNRGVLLTPFHNMALMCPDTTEADIDLHTKIFAEAAHQLTA